MQLPIIGVQTAKVFQAPMAVAVHERALAGWRLCASGIRLRRRVDSSLFVVYKPNWLITQWVNQREGSFLLRDQDGLAVKWECYKKLHKMKAQVQFCFVESGFLVLLRRIWIFSYASLNLDF